ncbi:MAG: transcription-repair coupling factor [Deltaproteobacteria bacterium]|nr:MAG: transcription-repair coupling factor [Deltaproteobacteria bacterium]
MAAPRAFLDQLPRLIAPGRAIAGLPAGAAAYAIARLAGSLDQPLLVVAATRDDAARLHQELRFHLDALSGPPVLPLPGDDVRTWDGVSPHPDIPRQRLAVLDALARQQRVVVVASARALQHRLLSPETFSSLHLDLRVGDEVARDRLQRTLADWGYLAVHQVEEPGTVAFRGGVVDIWSPGAPPVRLDFFDDELDEIRVLHPEVQRSGEPLSRTRILPAREAVVSDDAVSRASARMAEAVDVMGGGHGTRRRVLADLRQGLWFPGAEDFLGALHELVSWSQWWPADGPILVVDPPAVDAELERFWGLVHSRWQAVPVEERAPVLPHWRFEDAASVRAALGRATRIEAVAVDEAPDLACRSNEPLAVGKGELAPVVARLSQWLDEEWRLVLVCDDRTRAERVLALLEPHGLRIEERPAGQWPAPGGFALWLGALPRGFHSPSDRIALITADELFTAKRRRPAAHVPRDLKDAVLTSHTQLAQGDLVVHAVHGIGRFLRLRRLALGGPGGVEQDYAELEYRGGDRLYLPVTRLDQLYQYRAVGDVVPRLDKLGGETWAARKARVRDRVLAMAHEILALHAQRQVAEGHRYVGEPEAWRRFVEAFPYVETEGQQQAIDEVMADLADARPMDRLIVGDVGFGKTEVAMRAAMRVVLDRRQVAVLCPTTVLAFQHSRSFAERFDGFGVEIRLLSRFQGPKETREILVGLADGSIDIVIGTHTLLGRNVRFKDLGLVVVDEEHRFGVRQKERIKRLTQARAGVPIDTLAMSATPIPRTLYMAMSGLRQVSMIATPPPGRREVRTRVAHFDEGRIREEILHELRRGGQVFFVHNRVQSIDRLAHRLREIVPEARIAVAHGQMSEDELERVLVGFVKQESNVLLCTTIIESGVDMPNVNTIIVNRADRLGLAQLYQLRGRVGRATRRGYCTLLIPPEASLSGDAARRLQVLVEHQELGAGFAIAQADLELRGSGSLLGERQHGNIQAVGLDTYVELLEEAVHAAKGEVSRARLDPEVDLAVPALIPEGYMPDLDDRLTEYRRLAVCRTPQQVRDLVSAWEDRYGEPPPEVLNLGWTAEARLRCRELGIERVRFLNLRVELDFHESTPVRGDQVVDLVQQQPDRFQLVRRKGAPPDEPARRLRVRFTPAEGEQPFRFLHWALRELERRVEAG